MAGMNFKVAVALAILSSLACRGREKLEGEGPYGNRVAEAVPKIEAATGLKFKQPPKLETRSKDQVREFLEMQFASERIRNELQGMERAYKLFGLLPDTLDVQKLMIDLLTEQIVGYYDPKTKVLYVVDDAPDELIGITITHELVHALQDQYLNLDSIQAITGQNDRSTAAQAVIEGQAVFEQMSIMLGGNFAARLPGGWDRVRQMIREQSSAMPRFATAPVVIQETVIFPYLTGAEFVRAFKAERPGKSPLEDLPVSTEQVLNPNRYLAEARDNPMAITLPPPRRGTLSYENTLGAFETRLFLYQHLRDEPAAVRGGAGWGGDRYQVVRLPEGDALVWLTTWDSTVDAAEFNDVAQRAIRRRVSFEAPVTGADGMRFKGEGRDIVVRTLEVQGKPAVLYLDLPSGAGADLLDVSRVTIAP
jgi:hypothetical protein